MRLERNEFSSFTRFVLPLFPMGIIFRDENKEFKWLIASDRFKGME